MLIGGFRCVIDVKGRLNFPAKLRGDLGGTFIITKALGERCIDVYSLEEWKKKSEKISALLTQFDRIPLHVTRSVRWDSDHVVRLDDELCEIAKEIVRDKATDKVMIGLDFFDASINRIVAWVVGTNNMRKALLKALLEDEARLKADQEAEDYSHLFAYSEYMKQLPWSDVWRRLEEVELVKGGFDWYSDVKKYEEDVLLRRV